MIGGMGRNRIIEKHLNVGLNVEMLDFLRSESDVRGCTVVDVIRMGIYELMEKRKAVEVRRLEAEIRYRELLLKGGESGLEGG